MIRQGLLPFAAASIVVIAQTPAPAKPEVSSSKSEPTVLKKENFVRKISVGASLGALVLVPVGDGEFAQAPTSTLSITSNTKTKGNMLGWGGVVQVALPKKMALAGTFMIHGSKLETDRTTIDGVDNPFTTADERKITDFKENSSIRYHDYGLLFRRYDKDHTARGVRVFVQGGGAFRKVNQIRTTRTATIAGNTTTDNAPIPQKSNLTRGFTGGLGVQYNDDFGFRVVPEFRYTRWLDKTFDNQSYNSRKNQFEAILSITF